ncbi:hypothetical protein ACVW1A_003358 [Bradyrhizobium sp. LB1.3]
MAAGVVASSRSAALPIFDLDLLGLGDHGFQRLPPQPPRALGEIAGDIDRQRRVKFAQNRQRIIEIVAIAVVEREGGEAAVEPAPHQPLMQLVHADDVDLVRAQMAERGAQEFGGDFEMPVRLECGVAARPHVVQHENSADAR